MYRTTDQYVYKINSTLYLNLTNRCNLACVFCPRFSDYRISDYTLKLTREADITKFIAAIGNPETYKEVVFCGYGEPTLRLRLILSLARHLKTHWPQVPLRLNTNGLAYLVYGRNILPQLQGYIDSISVSLNVAEGDAYHKLCPSRYGFKAYPAVKNFIRQARRYIPHVTATLIDLPETDGARGKQLVENVLGVHFRHRPFMRVPSFRPLLPARNASSRRLIAATCSSSR